MKILMLNSHDTQGGGSRAAYRLHQGLLSLGIDSKMLVPKKDSFDPAVIGPQNRFEKFQGLFRPFMDQIPVRFYKNRSKTFFSPSWLSNPKVLKKIKELNPDIVHLHCVYGGFLSIKDIGKINKPIVWTFHDMWAFTGGETCDEGQEHWLEFCGNSKVLQSNKENDLSRKVWKKKEKCWKDLDLTIISPSKWMGDCARRSSLLRGKKMEVIPNGLDTNIYKPIDKHMARQILNLPQEQKIILFGADDALGNPNKGFHFLKEALRDISNKKKTMLVVFGNREKGPEEIHGVKTLYLGYFKDDLSLKIIYSSADLLVQASKQENLSNVIMESLSCNTPVVAFEIGGNSDMVVHKKTGYLAKPYVTQDLGKGIDYILDNPDNIFWNSRGDVLDKFKIEDISKEHIKIYKEVLNLI